MKRRTGGADLVLRRRLQDYLRQATDGWERLPAEPFVHGVAGNEEAVDWAVQWLPDGGELVTESYVNLIPTAQGGTHVNGLRSGLTDALREFCELRNLVPRGLKLTADDLWDRCAYVLSAKLREPQFSGQTKERLSSRQAAAFISGVARDAFSLWLNQHTAEGERIAELAIRSAQQRTAAAKKVARKKITTGPARAGSCSGGDVVRRTLRRGRFGRRQCQAAAIGWR